jgi:hypothetical protein
MPNVTLQAVKTALQVAVTNSDGEQDIVNVAAGASVILDSTIVARSQGIFAMVADGRLAVTAGSMPSAVYTDVPAPAPGASAADVALKAAKTTAIATSDLVVTALVDATDDATVWALANDLKAKYNLAVALVNELKAKLNTMNA